MMPNNTALLISAALMLAGSVLAPPSSGQALSGEDRAIEMTPESEAAIDRGLAFLAGHMTAEGSWPWSYGRNAGVCSFAGLAFMAAGNVPERGTYGQHVRRVVDYVASCAAPSGLIVQEQDASHGPMYEHAMATVLLAQAYGTSDNPGIRDKLERAVDLIVSSQNREGGWRYNPRPADADLSVTVMVLLALRSCNAVGVHVPKEVVSAAMRYVHACTVPTGGFAYQPGLSVRYGTTAAGTFSLQLGGEPDAPGALMGLQYLLKNRITPEDGHYFYGLYYGAMAVYQAEDATLWDLWFPPVRDQLLATQASDGHWDGEAGPIYGTAMAVLALTVPYRYLPVYQR